MQLFIGTVAFGFAGPRKRVVYAEVPKRRGAGFFLCAILSSSKCVVRRSESQKMISEKTVFHILEGLYENSRTGTAESWLTSYHQIAKLVSSGIGGLTVFVPGSDKLNVLATDFDEATLRAFEEYYQFVNPIREHVHRLRPGQSLSRIEICADSEFLKTEIYEDYFRKLDVYEIEYHALGPASEMNGGLTLTRPADNPHFSKNQRKALDLLVPHLQRAFHLYVLLDGTQRENRQMTEALSKIPQSIIVLDRSSKVIFTNESAERMIALRDGLITAKGILTAGSIKETRQLHEAVGKAFMLEQNEIVEPVSVIQLTRPSGLRPLQLLVAPFRSSCTGSFLPETLALVFVFDPEVRPSTADEILRRIYKLTPAEARIASLIAQGLSTKDVGQMLSISENTARTHLKRIFSKTDTSRQSDLMNLILNGPANLNNHSF